MDLTNTTLGGRYRLGAVIGTGGMSDVYAATDELLGRDVAVKMMRADLARDETFLERFRREAKNAAKLNHHAIVAVYDTGQTSPETGSVPYIVMERVHGSTLREIIRDSGPLPLSEAGRVMAEVCRALSFSHEAGIIHRDVKPANIMITNTGAVKVMDFGIARALSDSTSAMTQTSAVIGTAQYLSPEQARGRSADARSDIYAAGCVFYEITTGRPPFSGESPFSVAFQHVQDAPVPPSTLPGMRLDERQSLALDSVVLTAMAKDPTDRYDSADQMASDLRAVAERRMPMAAINYAGDQEVGQPSPDTESTTVFPKAGAAAAGAGLAGAAGSAAGPRASDTAAAPAAPADRASAPSASGPVEGDDSGNRKKKHRASTIAWIVALVALLGVGGVVAYNLVSGDGVGSSETQVSVPDVRDRPQAEAEQILEDAGFSVQVEEAADTDIERGNAIRTDPGTDSSVPEGSRITLFVSSGKEITEVPDLTGMNTEQAQRALSDVGLKLKSQVEEEPSDSVDAGKITSQSPGQGSQVSKGTEVAITVSTGAEKVRVPTVSGQQLDAAQDNLEGAGFTVNVQMVDSTEPENQVLSASDEGTQQPKGSTITITVSRGNQFTMPNLQNRTIDEVEALLKDAGWTGSNIQRDTVNTIDPLAIDRVVGQNDSPGSTVSKDATITVRVNVLGLPSRL
ncbi:Stk1 family PASTA domain-containing Ser/Thr kinase [Corynebacterium variabile]|uniref:Stk1 family PASTA domain-containing Ser/Thr kinase n=1 Tax=Corynebacterium variabile TaxID=1727 RepID=UPI0028EA5234|nr:Stk1 family PASTA domain-containing Ser/Thr kinase [Corynebacterium variabile]